MTQFKKQRYPYPCQSSSESGYTIIEGLVAIIVVAVMMTAVSPMIVWSVATRMQAKRVQLASQAATTYLATVRSDPENLTPVPIADSPENAPPPEGGDLTANCESQDGYCTETDRNLYCVNFDQTPGCQTNSLVDMVVQPVMTNVTIDPTTNEPETSKGYELNIRVYRANAFVPGITFEIDNDSTRVASNNGGIALIGRRNRPLTQMNTFISPTGSNYDSMCNKLGGCRPEP